MKKIGTKVDLPLFEKRITLNNSNLIVILGASDNPLRPSYLANKLLNTKGFKTVSIPYGEALQKNELIESESAHERTISIFLKPSQQKKYYGDLLSMHPSRIIFNPGTENEELKTLAKKNNIKVVSGCTIAMLMNSLL